MLRNTLIEYLDQLLQVEKFKDFCPNGLQVEGKLEISRLVTGVTACAALVQAAIDYNADAILVHHGYFWSNEAAPIIGMKRLRIGLLLQHEINLVAYHLPLDAHPQYGNNVQLGENLGINVIGPLADQPPLNYVFKGNFNDPISVSSLAKKIEETLHREPMVISTHDRPIRSVAWCTGAGQNFIKEAIVAGCDAYITGEASEYTTHIARESGIHFIAAGHHATERFGVQVVGEHLAQEFGISHQFVEIDNPV